MRCVRERLTQVSEGTSHKPALTLGVGCLLTRLVPGPRRLPHTAESGDVEMGAVFVGWEPGIGGLGLPWWLRW